MIVTTQKAAELIGAGDVVAIPTETVYGLAADAFNAIAVKKTFHLKGRPADNPLIVHLSSVDDISSFTDHIPDALYLLAEQFWPGPLTVVLQKRDSVLDLVTAGLPTVALRIPDHSKTLEFLTQAGPVTAPSANRSGRPSPTRPQHVVDDFGAILPVLDGGECAIGIESTVLDLSSKFPAILRPGRITAEEIRDVIKTDVSSNITSENQRKKSPGTRHSHYKPDAEVRWLEGTLPASPDPSTLYITHRIPEVPEFSNIVSFNRDYDALAKALYDMYRTADRKKYHTICIEPLPQQTESSIVHALTNRIHRSIDR